MGLLEKLLQDLIKEKRAKLKKANGEKDQLKNDRYNAQTAKRKKTKEIVDAEKDLNKLNKERDAKLKEYTKLGKKVDKKLFVPKKLLEDCMKAGDDFNELEHE